MHRCLLFFLALTTLLLLKSLSVKSQAIQLKDANTLDISSKVKILIDSTNQLDFEDIQNPNIQAKFKASEQDIPAYGYLPYYIWVKIELENLSTVEKDWLLHYDWVLVDTLKFYHQDQENKWHEQLMGHGVTFDARPLPYITYALPIDLPKSQTQTFYLHTRNTKPSALPLYVKQKDVFQKEMYDRNVFYGIYFGILIVMLLYNFFIWLFLQDRSYLYYILTIICTLTIFSTISGYTGQYIWPNQPIFNFYAVKVMMSFIIMTVILFTNAFLETKIYAPFFRKAFMVMFVLAIFSLIWTVLNLAAHLENDLLKIHTLLIIATGVRSWMKGRKAARFYVLAWIFYSIGGIGITYSNSGLLPINFFTRHGVEIGSAMEVILLSLALSDRYRIIRKEKEEATKELLKREKETTELLERKVKERTLKLTETNEELKQTNEELGVTLEMVNQQKKEIEDQREQILSSITYAKRIQQAILPSKEEISETLPQSFVFFRPRDIVSGDFYFYAQNGYKTVIAAVDCTGHGIPGAFMSLIGNDLLNEIVNARGITEPDKVLNILRKEIIRVLRQKETQNRDGMDLAICTIEHYPKALYKELGTPCLEYAGAGNPLIYFQEGEMKRVKYDKIIIGGFNNYVQQEHFTKHRIPLDKPLTFYIFSDGIQDQFGGPQDRKFTPRRLRELLQEIHQKPMEEQEQIIAQRIDDWKRDSKQIDDMLLIGVHVDIDQMSV